MTWLQLSVSGASFVAAIWLLRLIAKDRVPRALFSALWTAAAVRFLLPIRIETSLSIWSLLKQPAANSVSHTDVVLWDAAAAPAQVTVKQLQPVAQPSLLLWIWGTGVVLLTAYFVIGYIFHVQKFKKAWEIEPEVFPEQIVRELPRHVKICVTEDPGAPLTYGIIRPVILLPAAVEEQGCLTYILLHESIHIRRYDSLSKLLCTAALCLHWWNPLVWLLLIMANRDIEVACDEAVLRQLSREQKKDYANMLLDMQEQRNGISAWCSGFGKNAIEERIRTMAKNRKVTKITVILSVILALGTVTVFATQSPIETVQMEYGETECTAADLPAEEAGVSVPEPEIPRKKGIARWESPLPGEISVSASFGTRIHPVFGTEAFHDGVDLMAEEGTDILAVRAGLVLEAGFDEVKGYYLLLDHGDGYCSRYQHCKELLVEQGETVEQGNVIAYVGATGWATGPHLHFAVSSDDIFVDPMELIVE